MGWLLPTFQTVGAALGFLWTGIAIWNYATKERPTAVVVGAPLGGFGQRTSYLRVKNRSDRPILLHLEGGRPPTEMTVWPDHETLSAVYGTVSGAHTTMTVEPESEVTLPLIPPTAFEDMSDDSKLIAHVAWSYAQPGWWRRRQPLRVTISKWAFRAVVAGTLRESGSDT